MFPYCSHKEMNSPATQEKFKQGPVGILTVLPSGMPAMPKYLAKWFGFCLLVGLFAAYLAGRTLAPGTHYLQVFRVVGTTAFLGYSMSQVSDSIWKGQSWGTTVKFLVDGLVYGLLTAGTFGWLWPR